MKIIESWTDHNVNYYAIARISKKEQQKFNCKEFEALWLDDYNSELCSFGGTVGYTIADFDTVEEAKEFLLKGISEYDTNPEIWLEMVEV